eukprot:scaffold6403_cov128-Skeletonema_dohrnii-CCMP3373.AAC.3
MTAKGLPPSAHAISGAVGGAFATWLFYPLELLRVEMQKTPPPSSQDDENIKHDNEPPETNLECFIRLYKKQALYRGASAMVTTMLISSYITFFALESIRRSMATLKQGGQQSNRQQHTRQIHQLKNHIKFLNYILPKSKMGSSLLASTITGVINVFLTTPLWNGTRRIMESDPQPSKPISLPCINDEKKQVNVSVLPLKPEPSLWEMMYQIANDEGIFQLWHGTVSSLLLVSNPAIQYFLYEQIRVWILGIKSRRRGSGGAGGSMQLTAMEAFVFGALSKTVATVITYPLQLGQVLIRLRKNEVKDLEQDVPCMEIEEYNGMADCLYQQYTRGGFSSLFQGMSSKLVQTVGQASFIFVTYEQMLALVAKVIESR